MNQLSLFAAFACRFSPSDSDIQSRGNSSRPLALRGEAWQEAWGFCRADSVQRSTRLALSPTGTKGGKYGRRVRRCERHPGFLGNVLS